MHSFSRMPADCGIAFSACSFFFLPASGSSGGSVFGTGVPERFSHVTGSATPGFSPSAISVPMGCYSVRRHHQSSRLEPGGEKPRTISLELNTRTAAANAVSAVMSCSCSTSFRHDIFHPSYGVFTCAYLSLGFPGNYIKHDSMCIAKTLQPPDSKRHLLSLTSTPGQIPVAGRSTRTANSSVAGDVDDFLFGGDSKESCLDRD